MDTKKDYGGWVDLGKMGGGGFEQNTLHEFLFQELIKTFLKTPYINPHIYNEHE